MGIFKPLISFVTCPQWHEGGELLFYPWSSLGFPGSAAGRRRDVAGWGKVRCLAGWPRPDGVPCEAVGVLARAPKVGRVY